MPGKEWKNNASAEAINLRKKAMTYINDNYDEALKLMEKAAELGDPEAQSELADVCRAQDDPAGSFKWEKKAAEQGYPKAQYNLAIHYRDGIGTSVDPKQQFIWFQKAAENGLANAMCSLAVCYINGIGTSQNLEEATKWLRLSSEGGYAEAKRRLGAAYIEGIGVPIDEEMGLSLLNEAVSLGDETAKDLIKEYKKRKSGRKGKIIPMAVGSGICAVLGAMFGGNYWYIGLLIGLYFGIGISTLGPAAKEMFSEFSRIGGTWNSVRNEDDGAIFFTILFAIIVFIFWPMIKFLFKLLVCPLIVVYELVTDK